MKPIFERYSNPPVNADRNILVFLLALLGLGALAGGGLLIISPSGKLIGMPISMLERSPFTDFLIPGIILFFILGAVPCLLTYALISQKASRLAEKFNFFDDMLWSWSYSIYVAFSLIIWLQVEMVLLQTVYWLHNFYMFFAIAIISLALRPKVRSFYKK